MIRALLARLRKPRPPKKPPPPDGTYSRKGYSEGTYGQ